MNTIKSTPLWVWIVIAIVIGGLFWAHSVLY